MLGDARPGIPNFHNNPYILPIGSQDDLASPIYSAHSVIYDVRPDLIKLAAKSLDTRQILCIFTPDLNTGSKLTAQHHQRIIQALMNINRLEWSLIEIRV